MQQPFAFAFVACLAFAASAAQAQTATTVVGKGAGAAGMAQTVHVTAKITAIDKTTREITLRGPQGHSVVVEAGPEVKNFANMHVGDNVDVEYTEALTLELKKGSKAEVARSDKSAAMTAKPGAAPGAAAGHQITVMAEVMAVDTEKHTVTLRGPKRTIDLPVNDPEQLKLISKGDRVEATYTEAVAIAVTPAKKP